jgi:hypothetical protein
MMSETHDLTVEVVSLDIASTAPQRLRCGIAWRTAEPGQWPRRPTVDTCGSGRLERHEFDSQTSQYVLALANHRASHPRAEPLRERIAS